MTQVTASSTYAWKFVLSKTLRTADRHIAVDRGTPELYDPAAMIPMPVSRYGDNHPYRSIASAHMVRPARRPARRVAGNVARRRWSGAPRKRDHATTVLCFAVLITGLLTSGCETTRRDSPAVSRAVQPTHETNSKSNDARGGNAEQELTRTKQPAGSRPGVHAEQGSASSAVDMSAPIVTVSGNPISRGRLINLMLRSAGPGVLEQLVVLDEAERAAARQGLYVSEHEVKEEYEQALRMLTDPLAPVTTGDFDMEAAERALRRVLADRNVSHEEFMLGMRRRACLRKLVESQMQFTDQQLRGEMARLYGKRVRVRHIQLAIPRHVQRVKSQLDRGANFAQLAEQHSANLLSAAEGGLLQPFSMHDEGVPEAFRRAAFGLEPGQVSRPIRIGEWFHLIMLEETLPARHRKFEQAREELTASLRERTLESAIQKKYESLLRNARITIHDPVLRSAYEENGPGIDE